MKKYAVIDIGSNSVRLMSVADGKVLYKQVQTTRLGEGLAHSTKLLPQAIERSAKAVADFSFRAKEEGAESVYAFATAAVRSAENKAEFINAVQSLCGLQVEVIAGETEAEIGILGALSYQDGAVIDIGGASTEVVVQKNGAMLYKKSVNIGVVRLRDACGLDKDKLEETSKNAVAHFGEVPQAKTYAIGGTATALAAWHLGLKAYDAEKVTGTEISLQDMRAMAETLLSMSPEDIYQNSCMPKGRADVIAGGAVLLCTLMQTLGIQSIIVSDRDNLEGYATKKGLQI